MKQVVKFSDGTQMQDLKLKNGLKYLNKIMFVHSWNENCITTIYSRPMNTDVIKEPIPKIKEFNPRFEKHRRIVSGSH